jgi:LacI family transcriptional regulator, galactose operon repressor
LTAPTDRDPASPDASRARRPIMKDVADLAGVSRTTVSLVLNGRDTRIAEATRRRVEQAARDLNFRPSVAAQQLRTSRSKLVGLIGDEIATGPFAGGLIAGAQAAAAEREHALVVMNTGREGDLSVDMEVLEDRHVDALIFATVMTRPVALSGGLAGRSVILLNCFDEEHDFPAVLPDDRAGGAAATSLAASAGHRRIALLGGERGTRPAVSRLAGYRDAVARFGIPFDRALVRDGNWHADSGYEQARKVLRLRDPATALLCGNDRMALGAYDAIKELGLSIPRDISVIGYDDQQEIVAYMRPPLTTMRLPYYEMGRAAVAAILDGRSFRREMLRIEPVLRGSLAPVRTPGRSGAGR